MINRFNFYDIYGYLLPGGLLLTLLWLPFGLLFGKWPSADLSSAVLALGLAYITGHLLHILSEAAFPSKFKDNEGNLRYPSDLLIDKEDETSHLAEQIDEQFKIKIGAGATWTKDIGASRNAAFLKCRSFLIKNKATAYMEQQQGMYALMRGTGAALVLASALYIGAAMGVWLDPQVSAKQVFVIGIVISVLTFLDVLNGLLHSPNKDENENKKKNEDKKEDAIHRRPFWLLAMVLLCGGVIIAKTVNTLVVSDISLPSKLNIHVKDSNDLAKHLEKERILFDARQALLIREHKAELMLTMAVVSAILSLLCLSAFRTFAINYAATIYRDFSLYAPLPKHQINRQEYKHSGP